MTKIIFNSFKIMLAALWITVIMVHSSCSEEETSGCNYPAISNFNTVSVTAYSAELRFTDRSPAKSYSLKVTSAGTPILVKEITSLSTVLEGLIPDTEYKAEISAICPDGNLYERATVLTFRTKKLCTLAAVTNLNVTLDTTTNIMEAVWDAHGVATSYKVTIYDSNTDEAVWIYYRITENRLGFNLYSGMSFYVTVSPICEDAESASENSVSSSILTTKSLMPGTTVPSEGPQCIINDCSIIDAASPVLIPSGDSGGDYTVPFSLLGLNSCRTMYFRFSWSGGYADLPLYLVKSKGKISIYTQAAGCSAISNNLERKYADLLRQSVRVNGIDRYFGIVCFNNHVRIFVPPGIELRGKTY